LKIILIILNITTPPPERKHLHVAMMTSEQKPIESAAKQTCKFTPEACRRRNCPVHSAEEVVFHRGRAPAAREFKLCQHADKCSGKANHLCGFIHPEEDGWKCLHDLEVARQKTIPCKYEGCKGCGYMHKGDDGYEFLMQLHTFEQQQGIRGPRKASPARNYQRSNSPARNYQRSNSPARGYRSNSPARGYRSNSPARGYRSNSPEHYRH
jgi:hypothetical protein